MIAKDLVPSSGINSFMIMKIDGSAASASGGVFAAGRLGTLGVRWR